MLYKYKSLPSLVSLCSLAANVPICNGVKIITNLTIDVSFSYVCPVVDLEFRHNIVKVAVDPRGNGSVSANYLDNVMTEFIVNNRTDA